MSVRGDQDVRDEIRDALGSTMLVEAGAGTGKTTALVSRVVGLVASGRASLRNVAGITFTEAAASELRDRIREALERAAAGAGEPLLDPVTRERCTTALGELDDAPLSTLHGFAQRILAEHPLEAGLPPRFEVVDDVMAAESFEQRWGEFVDGLFADRDAERPLLVALTLGLRLDQLRDVARRLHESLDRLDDARLAEDALPPVDTTPVVAALRAALAMAEQCTRADDRLLTHLADLEVPTRALEDAETELDRLDTLAGLPAIGANRGDRRNWPCDVATVRAHLRAADAARTDVLDRCRRGALAFLVPRVRDFVVAFAAERRREGRLEFHDLLVLARDLLRRSAPVRAALSRRFQVLLIDEFQDTDPLQIEMALLLTTDDPGAGTKEWPRVAAEPGRLFLVGDPKQSIYRFRRADLALYHRVQHELREGDRRLTTNFRSVPGVIDWVNSVFGRLLAGAVPGEQAGHVQLGRHRGALPADSPAVGWFGSPATGERIGEVRAREAAEVAALVRRVHDEQWPVVDPETKAVRPAQFDDIALLLPTRTALPALERELESADVPVRVESQSLVYSTAEVREVLAIVTALDDPTDEIALVAALRTPAFGCADDELVEFHDSGGVWDYRHSPPERLAPGHRVAESMGVLRDLHDARWWRSVSATVSAIVRERRMLELCLVHRRPRDHWRRLRFLVDQARAYDESGGGGLRGFAEWVQWLSDERARAVELVVPERDDHALRILTVHGAKGLEFPVVVLAGLNAVRRTDLPPVLWGRDGRVEIGVGARSGGTRVETPGYAGLAKVEERLDEAEQVRLLYVAATRARDHLLVSLHHKAGDRCHAARLWDHVAGRPAERLDVPVRRAPARPLSPRARDEQVAVPERSAWMAQRSALLERAARPATVAATTLAGSAPSRGAEDDEPGDERPPWQRGRAGTAVGRAVHAVLQTVDLDRGEGLEQTARAQALAEGIPDREAEVRDLVSSVLDSPAVRVAAAGRRYWREVPVAAPIGGVTVEGFVDLLVDGPDGLVVVDYKTDAAPGDAELDAAMGRYRVQGAAYALALERVLGRPVARCVFVFARRGRPAVEREVPDLPAAVAEVETRVRAAAAT